MLEGNERGMEEGNEGRKEKGHRMVGGRQEGRNVMERIELENNGKKGESLLQQAKY